MVQSLQTSSSNNDLVLNASNSLTMLSGVDAVVQACKNACLGQLGEMVLQQTIGLPNFQLIWVGVPDFGLWQSALEQTILAVPGVTAVQQLNIAVRGNILAYQAIITTVYDTATITGSLPLNG